MTRTTFELFMTEIACNANETEKHWKYMLVKRSDSLINNTKTNQVSARSSRSRGTNQTGMRADNERLVLSLIREHGSLAKADIAKMTGLSAQTISVIMRELEAEGLLLRGDPIRGKVGQPLIPMALNPGGAFFLGLKVGRRSAQLVLIDVMGEVKNLLHLSYRYPKPDMIFQFAMDSVKVIKSGLNPKERNRIAGLGIALPFELWNWEDAVGAPLKEMDAWRTADIRARLSAKLPYTVYMQNDATAACGAELAFGSAHKSHDFIYFYIGYFVGGGVVLNGSLFAGRTGNAGALGSMLVSCDNKIKQLIDVASIATLELNLADKGKPNSWLWDPEDLWEREEEAINQWIDGSAKALAFSIVSSSAVIDFEVAIIDGWLPRPVLKQLIEVIKKHIDDLNLTGLDVPKVHEGTIGKDARVIGAASLPLSERFLLE